MKQDVAPTKMPSALSDSVLALARQRTPRVLLWLFWAFMAVSGIMMYHIALKAASFMPALRDAQIEFGWDAFPKGVQAFGPFLQQVYSTWDERLALHPVTMTTHIAIWLLIGLTVMSFFLALTRVSGDSVTKSEVFPQRLRDQASQLLAKFGFFTDMIRVKPRYGMTEVFARGRSLYIPHRLLEQVFSPSRPQHEKAIYLMAHEMTHVIARDNLLYAFLSALTLMLFVALTILVVNPVMLTVLLLAPPNPLVALGFTVTIGFALLGLVVAACWLLISGYAAMREYFADQAGSAIAGAEGFPYRSADAGTLGRMRPWLLAIHPNERLDHVAGLFPRAGAYVAGMLALWISLRTAVLLVSPDDILGPVWLFDLLALALIASTAALLWRQRPFGSGSRAPWLALLFAAAAFHISISAMVGLSVSLTGGAPGLGYWSVSFAWPLIACELFAAVVVYRIWRQRDGGAYRSGVRPLRSSFKTAALVASSGPSYIISIFIASFCGFTLADVGSRVLASDDSPLNSAGPRLTGLVLAFAGILFFLIVWNIVRPRRVSILMETGLVSIAFGFLIHMLVAVVAGMNIAGEGIPGVPAATDFSTAFLSPTTGQLALVLASGLFFLALQLISWWPRVKLRQRTRE